MATSVSSSLETSTSTAVALLTRAFGLLQSNPSTLESEAQEHIQKAIDLLTDNMVEDLVSLNQNFKSDSVFSIESIETVGRYAKRSVDHHFEQHRDC